MEYEFLILSKLPTLNEYIDVERGNKFKAAKQKNKFTKLCTSYALLLPKMPQQLYDVDIFWTVENDKTDADNVFFAVKFILDGVKAAGKLSDDNRKNIRHIHHYIETGKSYQVKVVFKKAEEIKLNQ